MPPARSVPTALEVRNIYRALLGEQLGANGGRPHRLEELLASELLVQALATGSPEKALT